MSQPNPSASLKHREYYDRAADAVPQFTVLNYGFSTDPEETVIAHGEPEFYCLRLYEHTVRDTQLAGREVLEVSCGRGGGAHFISRTFEPQRYVGIDLSEENVRLARARAARAGLTFAIGNAEYLDLPDASFDVVINVEASHLYDDRTRFFAEAARVLRPGGFFCYTDGCWADDDCSEDLLAAGFELLERREITSNVLHALRKDSARRAALFDTMRNRDLREEYKHWGGVVGYRAYNRFEAGQTRYFSHRLRKPR
jgi:ubiquinone/menaquinone biosynthesis C-methylase UbiE